MRVPRDFARSQIFERKNGCAFTQHHSGAISIKGPAFFGRGSLEGIEADEHELGKRVVAAGQHALVFARADAFECVADRIRAGGAGIGDDLAGRGNAKRFLRINRRFLRRIVGDPARRVPQPTLSIYRAVIILAERHAAACRADYGQFRFKPRALRERLAQRADHHLRGAMQTFCLAPVWSMGEKPFVRNLPGGLASALFDIEPRYWADAIPASA